MMRITWNCFCLLVGCWLTLSGADAKAAIVVGGVSELGIMPIQDVVLLPGTGLNPGTDEVLLADVTVSGVLTFDRREQVGTTIILENGRFAGTGFDARLGGGLTLTNGVGDSIPSFGILENVVQDAGHPGFDAGDPASIVSATLTLSVPDYRVRLEGLGLDVEVRDPFLFRADFDGLPPSPGTVYTADPLTGIEAQLDIYIAGTDTIIGYTTNRRMIAIAAVPEPSGLAAIPLFSALITLRRRKKH